MAIASNLLCFMSYRNEIMFNGAGTDNSIKVGYYDSHGKFTVKSFADEFVVKSD